MKTKIIYLLILFMIISMIFIEAQGDFYIYYKFNLDYDKGNINISSIEIEFSEKEIENVFGSHSLRLLDYNEEILNITFFDIPNKMLYDIINPETGKIEGGGERELEQVSFQIFIPYYENVKEIIIYNEVFDELIRKNIDEYSKFDEEVSEEDVKDEEIKKTPIGEKDYFEKLKDYWWVLVLILFVLIIVLFYSLNKKQKR